MTLRALIVDDEALARRRVRRLLAAHPDVQVVGECADGAEALESIRRLRPTLLFLDIQMPEVDGFAVLEALAAGTVPAVVFVTAHDEHALRAFDVHAVDYLLKPIARERFDRALARARREAGTGGPDAGWRALLEERRAQATRLALKCDGRLVLVDIARVDWIEADGNYVRLHAGRDTHFVRDTLRALEARLSGRRFVRVHRGTLVNAERIREVHPLPGGEQELVLEDGTRLRASRGYRQRLEEFLRSV